MIFWGFKGVPVVWRYGECWDIRLGLGLIPGGPELEIEGV